MAFIELETLCYLSTCWSECLLICQQYWQEYRFIDSVKMSSIYFLFLLILNFLCHILINCVISASPFLLYMLILVCFPLFSLEISDYIDLKIQRTQYLVVWWLISLPSSSRFWHLIWLFMLNCQAELKLQSAFRLLHYTRLTSQWSIRNACTLMLQLCNPGGIREPICCINEAKCKQPIWKESLFFLTAAHKTSVPAYPARLWVNQNYVYSAFLMFNKCDAPRALFRSVKSASAYSRVIYISSCCDFLMIFNRMPYEYHCQLQMWDIYCSDCQQSARSDLFAPMRHLTSSLWYKPLSS